MILVDTSVWINYFKGRSEAKDLHELLLQKRVVCHSWILGELALGNLGSKRQEIIQDLGLLPRLKEYSISEMLDFSEKETLYGKGLSLVDVGLLYTCIVTSTFLWSCEHALVLMASHYQVAFRK